MIDPSIRLRRAIHAHSLPLVHRILTSHPSLLHNPDTTLSPPGLSNTNLHLAASLPDLPITLLLLSLGHEDAGISLNTDHQTPLMLAAKHGHADITHALLTTPPTATAAADPYTGQTNTLDPAAAARKDVRGRDALMLAAAAGSDTCVQLLLTHAPPPSAAALAEDPSVTSAQALLRAHDIEGNTALHFASANGQLLVLRTLVAAGAEPERRNGWSWTAIDYSLTVQAEVYFKELIMERDERERERSNRAAAAQTGAGVGVGVGLGLSITGPGLRLVSDG